MRTITNAIDTRPYFFPFCIFRKKSAWDRGYSLTHTNTHYLDLLPPWLSGLGHQLLVGGKAVGFIPHAYPFFDTRTKFCNVCLLFFGLLLLILYHVI